MAFDLVARLKLQGPTDIDQTVRRIQSKLQSVSVNVALNVPSGTDTALKNFNASLSATDEQLRAIAASGGAAAKALAAVKSSVSGAQNSVKKAASSTKGVSDGLYATAKNAEMATTEIGEFGRISALALRRFAGFSLTAGLMIGLVVQIRRGISAATDFEREMVRVQQVTGKTVSGLHSLTDAIGAASTAYGVSSSELAEVTRMLSQAGLTAKQTQTAMEAIAKSDLSPTFENMKQTTEGVIAAMRQFKIEGKEIEAALGSINAVASSFAVESSDIISAIRRTGGAFQAAGGDLNELIALFTSVRATTRESADSIATGFRTIFTRMQRPRTIQFLKEFGIELQNVEGHFVGPYEAVRKLHLALKDLDPRDIRFSRIIEELGGFRQVSKAIPLIQQFTTAQQAMVASLAGSESVTEDAEIAQRSLAVQIGKVAEEYNKLFREIGESKLFKDLAEYALKFATNLTDVIRQIRPLIPLLGVIGAIQGMRMASQFGRGFSQGLFPVSHKESEALAQQQVAAQTQNTQAVEKNTVAQQSEATTAKVYTDALDLNTAALSKLTAGIMALSKVIPMMPGASKEMAAGGSVPGAGNRDTVPALLTPGEFVVNKHAARQFGYGNLREINQMSSGGRVMGSSLARRGGSSVLGRTLLSGQQRSPSRTSISPTNVARSALGVWNQDQGEFWRRMTEIHGVDKVRFNKNRIQMMFDDMRRYPHQHIKPELYGLQNIFGHQSIGPRDLRPANYDAFRDSANVMYDERLEHVLGYARGGVVQGYGPGGRVHPDIKYAFGAAQRFRKHYRLNLPRIPRYREITSQELEEFGGSTEGIFFPHGDRLSVGRHTSRGHIAITPGLGIASTARVSRHEIGHALDVRRQGIIDSSYLSENPQSKLYHWIASYKSKIQSAMIQHSLMDVKRYLASPRAGFMYEVDKSEYLQKWSDIISNSVHKYPHSELFAEVMGGGSPELRRLRRIMMSEGVLGEGPQQVAQQQQARIDKIMAGRSQAQGYARGGVVPGVGSGDTVPALLEPGEFVIRKSAAEAFGIENLRRINRYKDGDIVRPDGLVLPPHLPQEAAYAMPHSVAKPIADAYAKSLQREAAGVSPTTWSQQTRRRGRHLKHGTLGNVVRPEVVDAIPVNTSFPAAWSSRAALSNASVQPAYPSIPTGAGQTPPSSAHAGQAAQQAMFTTMMLGNFASTLVDADSAAQSWIQGATQMIITFNAMRLAMGMVQGLSGDLQKFGKVITSGAASAGPTMTHLRGIFSPGSAGTLASPHAYRQVPTVWGMGIQRITTTGGHVDALSRHLTGLSAAAFGTMTLIGALSAALIYLGEQARKESHEMAKDARTSAEMQAAIDRRRGGRALSSAGWGAATGAGIGFIVGSIVPVIGNAVGTAVGAGVGGALGWTHGMFGNMEAEIKELRKLNRESRVQEASESMRHALDRLTSGNIEIVGSNELRALGTDLQTIRTAQFQAEMAGDKDAALSYARDLRGMATQVQNVRDQLVSGASSLEDFESRTSASAQIIQYMAAMQRTSTYAIREQIKEEIAERNKARETMEKETHARERAVSLISTLNQFNAAMVETVQRLQRAGDTLEGIAGLARGDVVMPEFRGKPGFGEFSRITQGGVFDIKQFEDAMRQVGGGFESQTGDYMLRSSVELARTIDQLPQVIRNVVGVGATALDPDQLSGKFRDEFKALLGVKDDEGKPQITRGQEMVMNTIMSGIEKMIGAQGGEGGIGPIIQRMRTDPAGVLRELGLQDYEPIFKQWDDIAQGQLQAMQALDKVIGTRIQLETDMARKRIDLARQELSNRQEIFELTKAWPTDEFGADRVRESRGAQIAGVLQGTRAAGADPFDVERIGGALSSVNDEIARLSKERQEMKVVDEASRKSAMEAAVELGSLNTEAQKLRMALGVLADTTDEAAQIRQTLNRLEEEKKGQFGLLERYMFAGREEQQKILTSIHDTIAVAYDGVDIRQLPDDRRQALGSLAMGEFRNIRAMMFGIDEQGQGLTGGHFSRDVALGGAAGMKVPPQWQWLFGADLSGPAGRVAPGVITDEQVPLIDKMKQLHEEKHKAELLALKLTQDAHTKFIGEMGDEFKKFTTTLTDSLRQAERDALGREASVLQVRIDEMQTQTKSLDAIVQLAKGAGLGELSGAGALKLGQEMVRREKDLEGARSRMGRLRELTMVSQRYGQGLATSEGAVVDPQKFMSAFRGAIEQARTDPEKEAVEIFRERLTSTDQNIFDKMKDEGLLGEQEIRKVFESVNQAMKDYKQRQAQISDARMILTEHGVATPEQLDILSQQQAQLPIDAFASIMSSINEQLRTSAMETRRSVMDAGGLGTSDETLAKFTRFAVGTFVDAEGETKRFFDEVKTLAAPLKELAGPDIPRITTNLENFQARLKELNTTLQALGGDGGEAADAHATGGPIFRSRGTDTVPAMLTPGEFVVKRSAAQKNMELLRAINSGESPMYAAGGGRVPDEEYWGARVGPISDEELFGPSHSPLGRLSHQIGQKLAYLGEVRARVNTAGTTLGRGIGYTSRGITERRFWSGVEDAFPESEPMPIQQEIPAMPSAPTQTLSPSQQRAAQRAAARRARLGKTPRQFDVHPLRQSEMDQRERVRARLRGEDVAHMPRRHQEDIDARVRARSDALRAKKQATLNDIEDKLSRVRKGSSTERMYQMQQRNLQAALAIEDHKEFLNYRPEGSKPRDPEGNILPPGIYKGGELVSSAAQLSEERATREDQIRQRSKEISAEMQARRDAIRAQNQQRTDARIQREKEQQPGIYGADGQPVDMGGVRRRLNQRPTTGMWYDEPEHRERERATLWYEDEAEPKMLPPAIPSRRFSREGDGFWYGDGPSPTTPMRSWDTDTDGRPVGRRSWDTETDGRPVGPEPQPVTTPRTITPEAFPAQAPAATQPITQPITPRHPPGAGADPRFRARGHTPQKPLHQLRAESQERMRQIQAQRAKMEREFAELPAENLAHRRRLNQEMLLAENQDALMRIVGGDSVEGARARLEAMQGRVQAYDKLMTPEVPDAKTQRAMLEAESELNLRRPVRGTGAYAPDAVAPQRTRQPLGLDRPPVETHAPKFEPIQASKEDEAASPQSLRPSTTSKRPWETDTVGRSVSVRPWEKERHAPMRTIGEADWAGKTVIGPGWQHSTEGRKLLQRPHSERPEWLRDITQEVEGYTEQQVALLASKSAPHFAKLQELRKQREELLTGDVLSEHIAPLDLDNVVSPASSYEDFRSSVVEQASEQSAKTQRLAEARQSLASIESQMADARASIQQNIDEVVRLGAWTGDPTGFDLHEAQKQIREHIEEQYGDVQRTDRSDFRPRTPPGRSRQYHSGGLVPGSGNQSAILQGGEFVLPRPVVQALAKGGVVQGYQDGGTAQTPVSATGSGTGFQLVLADDAKSAMEGFKQEFAKTVQDFAGVVQGMEGFPAKIGDSLTQAVSVFQSGVDVFAGATATLPDDIGAALGTANTAMLESANALGGAMGEFNSGAALLGQSAAQLASTVAEFAAAADGMRGAAIEIRNALAQEVKISVTHTHQPLTVVVEGGETLTQDGDAFGEMVMRVVGPEIDRLRDRIRDTGFGIA